MAGDTGTHQIPLVGGGHALIDPCDYFLADQYKWRPGGTDNSYAVALVRDGKSVKTTYLHRLVMAAGPGEIIDHINGDPLDCRRENLRSVTGSENNANRAFTRRCK